MRDERAEALRRARVLPPALVAEPARLCEVMQGDDRLDALPAQRSAPLDVTVDRVLIEVALRRLDATPFYGEPKHAQTELLCQRQVRLQESVPHVTGSAGRLAPLDCGATVDASLLRLPARPVRIADAAFDLVRSGRGAKKE